MTLTDATAYITRLLEAEHEAATAAQFFYMETEMGPVPQSYIEDSIDSLNELNAREVRLYQELLDARTDEASIGNALLHTFAAVHDVGGDGFYNE